MREFKGMHDVVYLTCVIRVWRVWKLGCGGCQHSECDAQVLFFLCCSLVVSWATDLARSPADGLVAGPVHETNLLEWEAMFLGPQDTPYEFGIFRARLTFPADYPHNPVGEVWLLFPRSVIDTGGLTWLFPQPKMVFITPIWHPNIYNGGTVCCFRAQQGIQARRT